MDKVGIVTGGGGRLGSLVTRTLLDANLVDRVVSLDIAHPDGAERDCAIVRVDVDAADRDAVRDVVTTHCGQGVRAVVNCLGISPKNPDGSKVPIPEITSADWERVFRVNVLGPLVVIQQAWPFFIDHATTIVNILSLVAKTGAGGAVGSRHGIPSPAGAHYGASKAALANLTLSLSRELGPRGIRANAVSPGQIEAGMLGSVRSDDIDRMVDEIPLGRYARYQEIADAVEFLSSPHSSYVTGEILDVNGGWYAD